tara:strand:+ start:4364 stop:5452 length:1089 start_codon:yes stop_codon:yes gene_type:complete
MSRAENKYIWNVRMGILVDLLMSIIFLLLLQFYLTKGLHFQFTSVFYVTLMLVPAYFYFFREHQSIRSRLSASYTSGSDGHLKRHILKFLALKFCFLGIVFAISDPVFGEEETSLPLKTGDVMVCLDLSRSMDVKDVDNSSRLEAGRNLLKSMVNKLSGQRIGLCVFAQNAVVQLPLTRDYEQFKLMISEANTNHFSNQGTNIGGALMKAMSSFEDHKLTHSILLITDGEDHEASLPSIVDSLNSSNIKLLSIAIGTESGGPILRSDKKSMRIDASGNIILSKVDLSMVKKLADQTNGPWFHITETYPKPDPILTEINLDSMGYSRDLKFKVERRVFHAPLFLALLSFFMYALIPFRIKTNR